MLRFYFVRIKRHYSSLLHALKWERPKSILITKKRKGPKYLPEPGHVLIETAPTESELQGFFFKNHQLSLDAETGKSLLKRR